MVCPKCKLTIAEQSAFCPNCGENLTANAEQNNKFCSACGEKIQEDNKFCAKCGTRVGTATQPNTYTVTQPNTYTNSYADTSSSSKITGSYFVSVISAIISLIIRIATQEQFISWSNLMENRKLLGIDSDLKPFISVIPALAAIIVSLLLASDKNTSTQKKTTALIVNVVFIALSILFIWFDIPSAILDF